MTLFHITCQTRTFPACAEVLEELVLGNEPHLANFASIRLVLGGSRCFARRHLIPPPLPLLVLLAFPRLRRVHCAASVAVKACTRLAAWAPTRAPIARAPYARAHTHATPFLPPAFSLSLTLEPPVPLPPFLPFLSAPSGSPSAPASLPPALLSAAAIPSAAASSPSSASHAMVTCVWLGVCRCC